MSQLILPQIFDRKLSLTKLATSLFEILKHFSTRNLQKKLPDKGEGEFSAVGSSSVVQKLTQYYNFFHLS